MIKLRPFFKTTFLNLAALTLLVPNLSFAEDWGTPYEEYFEDLTLQVEEIKTPSGFESRSLVTKGQIRIIQRRKDGEVQTATIDQSGRGAVLCARKLYIATKLRVDQCTNLKNKRASRLLGDAIEKIDRFVVENNVEGITYQQLRKAYAQSRNGFIGKLNRANDETAAKICEKNEQQQSYFLATIARINAFSDVEFDNLTKQLLGKKRLAVTNPCL